MHVCTGEGQQQCAVVAGPGAQQPGYRPLDASGSAPAVRHVGHGLCPVLPLGVTPPALCSCFIAAGLLFGSLSCMYQDVCFFPPPSPSPSPLPIAFFHADICLSCYPLAALVTVSCMFSTAMPKPAGLCCCFASLTSSSACYFHHAVEEQPILYCHLHTSLGK